METPAFYFRSWAELRDHDKLAYDAIHSYAQNLKDGHWALCVAEDMECNKTRYCVELKSMSKFGVVTVVFQRQGLDYLVESSSSV